MYDFLPLKIRAPLYNSGTEKLCEIRLRAGRPVMLRTDKRYLYLSPEGVTHSAADALKISVSEIAETVLMLCERSVYAYADKIRNGFISLPEGIRVGICGECVIDDGKIVNVKNVSSLNIRIHREVKGCANAITALYAGGIKNTLIVSPPGAGKTTVARDIAGTISEKYAFDVLVCDERNEIFPLMSRSDTVDCITYGPKKYAFENGIRAMTPSVIVTDEIVGNDDAATIYRAFASGVKVIATAHGKSAAEFVKREEYVILKDVFDLYVTLDESMGKGTVKEILSKEELQRKWA
ncbi:MAG: hypothetical protein J6Z34_05905 [Clostridia bacterium]|nr:hypothetical protein [Clostridia bacterium]